MRASSVLCSIAASVIALACSASNEDSITLEPPVDATPQGPALVGQVELVAALDQARLEASGGLIEAVWVTVLNHSGAVAAVAHSTTGELGAAAVNRVVSAQKANTANAFSADRLALSSANLFVPMQPGGVLHTLAESNPMDTTVARGGDSQSYGTSRDFMIGKKPGGVNVLGGGLALYDASGLVGALGVSGDTPCANHNIAWKVRDQLGLDHVPGGVAPDSTDNIIYDMTEGVSLGGFGHPECADTTTQASLALPETNPIGE